MHPILFKLGPITVYSYGTAVAAAFLISTFLALRELKRNPVISSNQLIDLALYGLIAGLLGARLLHVILNFDFYGRNPSEIPMLSKGGMAFQGGIISAVAFGVWYLKKKKLPVLKALDLIIPYVALGQGIGRIGCFLNGCCYGRTTEYILALAVGQDGALRHPTQLYSAVGLLAIFLVLRFLYKRKRFDGQVFLYYFILYSVFRFSIDFLRGDIKAVFLGLTISQLISVAMLIIGTSLLVLRKRNRNI